MKLTHIYDFFHRKKGVRLKQQIQTLEGKEKVVRSLDPFRSCGEYHGTKLLFYTIIKNLLETKMRN